MNQKPYQKKCSQEAEKDKESQVGQIILKCLCAIGMTVLLLGPAVVLDVLCKSKTCCNFFEEFFLERNNVIGHARLVYNNAMGVLEKNVGIIVTSANLAISLAITLLQNSTINVFGIPQSELEPTKKKGIYNALQYTTFIAPIIMLVILNFGLCITGYWLILCSYIFLVVLYTLFISSLSEERKEKIVANKIVGMVPDGEELTFEDVQSIGIIIDMIGNSFVNTKSWDRADKIFSLIIEKLQNKNCEDRSVFAVTSMFYDNVYCGLLYEKVAFAGIGQLKDAVRRCDEAPDDKNILIFQAVSHVAFRKMSEEQTSDFLRWFLRDDKRGAAVIRGGGNGLCDNAVAKLNLMVLELLEHKLSCEEKEVIQLESYVVRLWEKIINAGIHCPEGSRVLSSYEKFLEDTEREGWNQSYDRLVDDITEGTRKSIISNMVYLLQGESGKWKSAEQSPL